MFTKIADWIVFGLLRLDPASRFGEAVHFFVVDVIKIYVLLFVMISFIGFLRSFLSASRIKEWIGSRGLLGYLSASLFGIVTPFCSCSSIPIFIGLLKAGVPVGVTFSFLITSPLINEYLVVLMLGFFGWKITLAYILNGVLIGVVAGLIISKVRVEGYLVEGIVNSDGPGEERKFYGLSDRFNFGIGEAITIFKRIWLWVMVGVGIGALLHNFVPNTVIQRVVNSVGVFSVPIAVLLGAPMYGSCAAIVPIAVVLFQKGVPLGTALAFMMSTSALSLPEAVLLRQVIRLPLIILFFMITIVGIIGVGYLMNLLYGFL